MAQPLQDVRNLQFRVETMMVQDGGRKLRKLTPDENGYYSNVPVTALGAVSRNRTYYEVDSFVRQIRDPNCSFNELLVGGQLYGEWGHPNVIGLSKENAFARLLKIDENCFSHHFNGLSTGKTLEDGGVILEAKLKPVGPHRDDLRESLENPCENTAFSLRAITESKNRDGVSYRVMKKLVTFDYVGAGGYRQASKVFSGSTENFDDYTVELEGIQQTATFTQVALESFTDTELNDVFGASKICRATKIITFAKLNPEDHRRLGSAKYLRSIYHEQIRDR